MGARHSSNSQRVRDVSAYVRVFYLIFGEPTLRYARPGSRGPLIFDVHVDSDADDEDGADQHAETMQLPTAVPTRQDFAITPCTANTTKDGYMLSFRISADAVDDNGEPSPRDDDEDHARPVTLQYPRMVEVFAGVKVDYIEGTGVRLSPGAKSQRDYSILTATQFDSRELTTREPLLLHQLSPAAFDEPSSAAEDGAALVRRRLTAAPLCIVSHIVCEGTQDRLQRGSSKAGESNAPSAKNKDDDDNNNNNAAASPSDALVPQESSGADVMADVASASGPDKTASPLVKASKTEQKKNCGACAGPLEVVLYTFLDFPPEAFTVQDAPEDGVAGDGADHAAGGTAAADNERETSAGRPSTAATRAPRNPLEYKGHVVKQLMQMGAEVYELESIFGIEEATYADEDSHEDGGGGGAEENEEELCVICLSNPRDTAILPCRHMCLCGQCALQLRMMSDKCPICRCNVERIMTM